MGNKSIFMKKAESLISQLDDLCRHSLIDDGLTSETSQRMALLNALSEVEHKLNGVLESDVLGLAIDASFDDDDSSITVIDDVKVDWEVFGKEMVEFTLRERDEEIENLIGWLSESKKDSDKVLMLQDLKMLLNWTDEYVFSSISTNKYVSPTLHMKTFNAICRDVLKANEELNKRGVTLL